MGTSMVTKKNNEPSKEELILAWTEKHFSESIQTEANSALEQFRNGKSSPDVEGYTVPLEFGTGGIRGVIGNGCGRMNVYTVGRSALGYCRFLLQKKSKSTIVIAYDSRRMSKEFAQTSAGVAASLGIKVKLFKEVAPTPILSYSIRHYKADGGIVITASHNPPEYNGFKAYLSDGGQLVAPDDKMIIDSINAINDWSEIPFLKSSDPVYKKLVSEVEPKVFEAYKKKVFSSNVYNKKIKSKDRESLRIVYSPLHGTGGKYMKDLLDSAGYKNVFLVKEQEKPNGEFPTVKYPNPEEREALALCIETSKKKKAGIFIATDPDADRLGIGVRDATGEYVLLNGNQIGSIMCAYLAEKISAQKSEIQYKIIKTIVTTDLQQRIADKNKIPILNVLTGFKFIAAEMLKMDSTENEKFLFGGEESYGYLPVDFVRDKDSFSSALLLLEICTEKKDILSYLNEIYMKYGFYLESLASLTLKGETGKQKIKDTLDTLRKTNLIGKTIGRRKIESVIDYKEKKVSGKAKKSIFSGMPSSDVIQLVLEGDSRITIRPSGTEPKVKVYFSFCASTLPKSNEEVESQKVEIGKEIEESKKLFLEMVGLNG